MKALETNNIVQCGNNKIMHRNGEIKLLLIRKQILQCLKKGIVYIFFNLKSIKNNYAKNIMHRTPPIKRTRLDRSIR